MVAGNLVPVQQRQIHVMQGMAVAKREGEAPDEPSSNREA